MDIVICSIIGYLPGFLILIMTMITMGYVYAFVYNSE